MFVEMDKETKYIRLIAKTRRYIYVGKKPGILCRAKHNNEDNIKVVQSLKYVDSILNVIEKEIKRRITQGNHCFYALFKSSPKPKHKTPHPQNSYRNVWM